MTKLPFALERLKAGDIVVFRHPAYGVMIKRLERLSEDGQELYVLGAHPESTDSRSFGPVPRRWVTGKVIWRIASPPPKGKPT